MTEILLFHHAQWLTPGVVAFADSSLPDYDEAAATLLEKRALSFLDRVG